MAHQQGVSGTNCFTISRFGAPMDGIILCEEAGPDALRPWVPHIKVGAARIHKDFNFGCEDVKVGDTRVVYKAHVVSRQSTSGRTIHTLKSSTLNQRRSLILKINLGLSHMNNVATQVNGRNLWLYVGAHGGTPLERDAAEAVVKLEDQEYATCFFFDGGVRVFKCHEGGLYELTLGSEAMLKERIARAKLEVEKSSELNGPSRDKRELSIVLGMVDLLNLTSRFDQRGLGQQMRISIIREFFLKIDQTLFESVRRRLAAVLYQLDPALVPLLWKEAGSQEVQPPQSNVVDLSTVRALREKKRRDKVQHDRRVRQAMKGRAGQVTNASSGKKSKK